MPTRMAMIDLEKALRVAALARGAHECASMAVALGDLAASSSCDTSRIGWPGRLRPPGSVGRTCFRLLELLDEELQRLVHDDGEVAAGVGMAHQRTGVFELFTQRGVDGQRDLVASLGQRLHLRPAARRR